jgi:hypothetical protein
LAEATLRYDLLFETSQFNVLSPKEYFINPCCFGEDAATWLQEKLIEKGFEADVPGQEDWGWYLQVGHGENSYFLGFGGYLQENATAENTGEWRIMIEKHRSVWDRLCNKNKMHEDEPILAVVEDILRAEPDICHVRRETGD